MCNGSIMDKLISFALPLMLSGILQLMFNAVDIIVVGHFSSSQALAAVGSTTAIDQRVRQSVYRCFSWNKRPCGKVLCRRKGQRDVRGCAYLHLICTDKRYCDGDNRSASGKAGIAAYADTCGCD